MNENSVYAPDILFELARLYRQAGNKDKAAAALRQLLERHPESPLVESARKLAEALK